MKVTITEAFSGELGEKDSLLDGFQDVFCEGGLGDM